MGMKEPPVPTDEDSRLSTLNSLDLTEYSTQKFIYGSIDFLASLSGNKACSLELVHRRTVLIFTPDCEAPQEKARNRSLASFAILDDEPLIIHDLSTSSYWNSGPSEEVPNIHTYFGCPIILDGQRIGALCLASQDAQEFSVIEMHSAKRMALQIQDYLKLVKKTNTAIQLIRRLQKERSRFATLQNVAAIAELNTDGEFTFTNEQFAKTYGYTTTQTIGRKHSILLPYNQRNSEAYTSIWQRLTAGEVVSDEYERITQDKETIWVLAIYVPVLDFSGETVSFVEYWFDITTHKLRSLRDYHYHSILDKNLVLVEADGDGKIIDANTNFCDLLGQTLANIEGKSCRDLAPNGDNQTHWPWEHSVKGEANPSQFPFLTSWDEVKWVDGLFVKMYPERHHNERYLLIGVDGTKRKQSQIFLSEIVNGLSSDSAVAEFSIDGKIQQANSTFLRLLGYGYDEVLGADHAILLGPDEFGSHASEIFWAELCSGRTQVGQFERFNRFGEKIIIHGLYLPVRDDLGKIRKIVLLALDATDDLSERDNIEVELQQLRLRNVELKDSFARYLTLGTTISIGLFATDTEGNFSWLNGRFCQLLQRSYQELIGQNLDLSAHPVDASRVATEWQHSFDSLESYTSTHRILALDGTTLSVEVKANPSFNQGVFVGYVGTMEDLTEEEIARERLNLATAAAQIGIWDWYVREDSLVWDSTMLSIYGISPQDYSGAYDSWKNALLPGDRQRAEYELKEALDTGRLFQSRYRIRRPDGQIRVIEATGCVLRDHLEEPIRVIGTNIDVTAQQQREAEMRLMRRAAETAAQAKSDFLANMSHEIRTPLTSIIGYAENACGDEYSDMQRKEALQAIMVNGEHLLQIINDILDLSKINAGALRFENKQFSPVQLVKDVESMLGTKVKDKEIELHTTLVWELPDTVRGDPFRTSQILLNLLSNAIKFTPRGSVTLKMWCDRQAEHLHFEVSDTGIGMDTATISKLFAPFSQGDDSTTRKFGGTGLGLTISKELVTRMGGQISVASEVGAGTTFSFYVPTGPLSQVRWLSTDIAPKVDVVAAMEPSPLEEMRGLTGKVLIADDAPEVRALLQFALQMTDLELTFVTDGQKAIDMATSRQFDLIMLDMQMPIMDGYTAAQVLRKNGIGIPIIAFTANALSEYVDRSLKAGCTEILVKPFTKQALARCLLSNMSSKEQTHSPANQPIEELRHLDNNGSSGDVTVCSMFEEDPEMLDLVYSFVEILGVRLQKLALLNQNGNYQEISEMLHSARMYGYPVLDEIVEELSAANKSGDGALFASLIDKLETTFSSIVRGVVVMEQQIQKGEEH
jgi:PAS domain S-box-containing protein